MYLKQDCMKDFWKVYSTLQMGGVAAIGIVLLLVY